jgi:hypothetical protein
MNISNNLNSVGGLQSNPTNGYRESMPESFMGYKVDPITGALIVRCCSWCKGKEALHNWAKNSKLTVTDGICTVHYNELMS